MNTLYNVFIDMITTTECANHFYVTDIYRNV